MTTRTRRVLLVVIALVILLPVVAFAIVAATFDANRYKPQIAEAVKRATGRDLVLGGTISVKLSFRPTLEARDVALANIEGGSRPQMAKLDQVEAQIALLPLLRSAVEIDSLVLVHPDMLLESNAQGQPNWRFGPAVTSQALPQPPAPANASKAPPPEITVREVRIEDGTLTYRAAGKDTVLAVSRFEARADSRDAPISLAVQASYEGADFTLNGDVGPLARLENPDDTTPWPVRLVLAAAGATVNAEGALLQPLQGRGYDLRLGGTVPDLAALQPFYPRAALPALHDLTFAAQLADGGGGLPHVSASTAHAGASDLSALVPGLSLAKLDIAAPRLDQPMQASAEGSLSGAPLSATATLGAPEAFLAGAPFPVDVTAQAAGATASVKGVLANPGRLSGASLAVIARIPDLASLSPLARRPLPPLKDIAFQGTVAEREGGFSKGLVLRDARLTGPQGDVAGTVSLGFGPLPSLDGTLAASRIDIDALTAALAAPRARLEAAQPAAPPPIPAQPTPPSRAPTGRQWVIPDTPLPFEALRQADADLQFTAGALVLGGSEYHDLAGHLVLQNGNLRLDPFAAQLPGSGALRLKLTADAAQLNPPVSITLRAPALAVQPLLAMLHQPGEVSGTAEVDLDVRGAGRTPHAIAAGADGHLGIAMLDGRISNQVLADTVGVWLRQANLAGIGDLRGQSDIRCFAARLDAAHGNVDIRALLLDSTLVHVDGSGSLNLADETMALRLQPLVRLGGTGVVVPIRVTGPFRTPKAALDAANAAGEAARLAEAAGAKSNTAVGIIIGALGADHMLAGSNAGHDTCAQQLALARDGRAGPVPAAAPAPPAGDQPAAKPKPPKPADLLRQFFR